MDRREPETVDFAAFNRHPARYVERAYLLNRAIYVVRKDGSVVATLRGYAADTALRLRAAREQARATRGGSE
jgi:hypothetical protein